ncbi:hypothetical protein Glove_194g140 [Diversispora epigaea]|uniref:Uncharacterized protein n=1 Tax=Diversispora epigaea TaxID=1348612 RepID=A0A397IL78_9GLOM|nr:hypothetical protein Glove_194g140 [Diversispora epigaea]
MTKSIIEKGVKEEKNISGRGNGCKSSSGVGVEQVLTQKAFINPPIEKFSENDNKDYAKEEISAQTSDELDELDENEEDLERVLKELEEEVEKELNEATANSKSGRRDDNYVSNEDIPLNILKKRRILKEDNFEEDILLKIQRKRRKLRENSFICHEILTEIKDSDSTTNIYQQNMEKFKKLFGDDSKCQEEIKTLN